jgi:hypothetical protein
MGTPQIILIVLLSIGLLVNAYMHGKPKSGTYNLFKSLMHTAIMIWILIAGGFFG